MKNIDFKEEFMHLQTGHDMVMYPDRIEFGMPNARKLLETGLTTLLGSSAIWLKAYDEVADWLSDNKGKGLLCVGPCGLGKTVICERIIPALLSKLYGKIVMAYDAVDMDRKPDEILRQAFIMIDDLGTESGQVRYQTHRKVFAEICDAAEKKGKLLIVTSNLSTEEILARYGERTLDRLSAITNLITFASKDGKSMRGPQEASSSSQGDVAGAPKEATLPF